MWPRMSLMDAGSFSSSNYGVWEQLLCTVSHCASAHSPFVETHGALPFSCLNHPLKNKKLFPCQNKWLVYDFTFKWEGIFLKVGCRHSHLDSRPQFNSTVRTRGRLGKRSWPRSVSLSLSLWGKSHHSRTVFLGKLNLEILQCKCYSWPGSLCGI